MFLLDSGQSFSLIIRGIECSCPNHHLFFSPLMTSTFEQLKGLLIERFDADAQRVTPDVAVADMGLDSLTLMEFIFAAEDHFSLRLPEEKLDPRQAGLTLAEVAAAIDQELANKKPGA